MHGHWLGSRWQGRAQDPHRLSRIGEFSRGEVPEGRPKPRLETVSLVVPLTGEVGYPKVRGPWTLID
jgi:hypothetical protein